MYKIFSKYLFNRAVHIGLCCLTFLILMLGCSSRGPSQKYHIIIDDSYIGEINFQKKHALKRQLEQAIRDVTQYFDTCFTDTLYVNIFGSRGSSAGSNQIYFFVDDLPYGGTIIHEVTHAVLPLKRNLFTVEGLAVFMQYKFTNDRNDMRNTYRGAVSRKNDVLISLSTLIQNNSIFFLDADAAMQAYDEAGSFFQFVEDTYGRAKVKEFYFRGTDSIETIFGASVDSLDTAWRKWLWSTDYRDYKSRKNTYRDPDLVGKSGSYKGFLELKGGRISQ